MIISIMLQYLIYKIVHIIILLSLNFSDVLTPTVSTSPVLLKMKIRNTQSKEFTSQQDSFLTNVKNVLSRRGYGDVDAGVHSISQDEHLV